MAWLGYEGKMIEGMEGWVIVEQERESGKGKKKSAGGNGMNLDVVVRVLYLDVIVRVPYLDVIVRVPVAVVDDDGVGGSKVDAETAGARRQQEAERRRLRRYTTHTLQLFKLLLQATASSAGMQATGQLLVQACRLQDSS